MIALLPLAGLSERFTKSGYNSPKWRLPLPDGRTMLRTVLDSIGKVDTLVTVARTESMSDVLLEVSEYAYDKKIFHIPVWVDSHTSGPFDTIMRAKKHLRSREEFIINYADCWAKNGLSDFAASMRSSGEDAGVYAFRSPNPRFQRDESGNYALGGMFWFRHADEFLKQARHYDIRPDLSPAHIAGSFVGFLGRPKFRLYVDTQNYVDVGTPEDYERFCGIEKKVTVTLPVLNTFEEFMADETLAQAGWKKDRIGWLLWRSANKMPMTDAENRELAADMNREI